MKKRYLLFASYDYAYHILRPLQDEILRQGHEVKWFLEDTCTDRLTETEERLLSFKQVKEYNPLAVLAAGNIVYDFFPGVKVNLLHGYNIPKRLNKPDNHYRIRGWFDIYCSQGPRNTPGFKQREEALGFFKTYETGWCRVDEFFREGAVKDLPRQRKCVYYATTFTQGVTSAPQMLKIIDNLASEKPWDWVITFHPLLRDKKLIESYKAMASRHSNVRFLDGYEGLPTLAQADAMLCDNSSIILEMMLTGKPVVTYNNTYPGPHIINCTAPDQVGDALEIALTRPPELMKAIEKYVASFEAHRDGHNSERVLAAVDDFIANYKKKLKKKPLNLFRKLKLRWKLRKKYIPYLFGFE
ncbi:MAG: CDP-glycerol glycerophosphotransferase family protein [Muribaculum sp.]|nr:CDP-glycerol glycerophosphotransferase family protein [Muribaculaceae bacterium]MCM1081326.1 CDP-glycerol glycerophosphotransferase family protein [Muribaculum sp.]